LVYNSAEDRMYIHGVSNGDIPKQGGRSPPAAATPWRLMIVFMIAIAICVLIGVLGYRRFSK
jgi:hypothetical protein